MIIRQLELLDFGIYGGKHALDLSPVSRDGSRRPIILLRGRNGAGKTTIIEAIRLCLHGSLALGSRISQAAYESYLARHIHVPRDSADRPSSASIAVALESVSLGRRRLYRIERSWHLAQGRVKQELEISEDGMPLASVSTLRQKESFLRELVPPQVADIFFFDGERLQSLAGDGRGGVLANTVKTLFGLNLLEQLQKDLDIYLERKMDSRNAESLRTELRQVGKRIEDLQGKLDDLLARRHANAEAMETKLESISAQDQRIAGEGRWFADQQERLRASRQRLELEIELLNGQAQDMCSGLVPFAIAPEMCKRLTQRLLLEEEFELGLASERMLEHQLQPLRSQLISSQFWADAGIQADEFARETVLEKLEGLLRGALPARTIPSEDVILQVSDQDKQTLLAWIEEASTSVPQQFCRVTSRLGHLSARVQQIDRELELVPAEEVLKPLVEELRRHHQELGGLQKTDQNLMEEIHGVEYELEQMRHRLRQIHEQIAVQEHHDKGVQLAASTQAVLEEYARELNREKITLLERALTASLNRLSRKGSLVDAVRIDPENFAITLLREGQPFERNRLSAGENQLLAVAIIWALREVSQVPMPVVMDTPLGRLDSEHRLRMVQDFFPRASHQTVLFVTDSELEDPMLSQLAPSISRIFRLDYDPERGGTDVRECAIPDAYPVRGD